MRFPPAVPIVMASLLAAAAVARADVLTEPMRGRNLSPPIAIFGVPSWTGGLDAGTPARFSITGDMASHFRFSSDGRERLILDGETWRANLIYERRVADAWTVAAELPLVRNSGGVLDDFIDAWHSVFNLPDGNRNMRPEDELQLFYDAAPGPGPSYFRTRAGNGFGDLLLSASTPVGRDGAWALKLSVKLPTGDEDLLAGSGAADAAVSVLRRGAASWRSRPFGWFFGGGLLRLGQPETFPAQSRDWVALAMAGLSWQAFPRVGLKAQLDAHTAFYHSALEEIGNAAMQATVGGWWTIDERRVLTAAVVEDLIVRAAPDVSLQIGFEWRL